MSGRFRAISTGEEWRIFIHILKKGTFLLNPYSLHDVAVLLGKVF